MAQQFKIVKIGTPARDALVKGANFLGDAVKSTLGPFGSNFFLEKKNRITNDGVTIARDMELRDELENRGVVALREAAIKTNDEVGDGTTTAITLAQAILKSAIEYLGKGTIAQKRTPVQLKQKIEQERKEITDKLIAMATTITTEEQLISSATVSVEDPELGKIIGEAQWKIGKEGVLIAEEVNERTCSIEMVNGVIIDNGFTTSISINNQEKQSLEVADTAVILTNYVFSENVGLNPLNSILEQIYKLGTRHVIIIARAFSSIALQRMMNETKNGFCMYPINAPYEDQADIMKDLEAVLGGRYIDSEQTDIQSIKLEDIGTCEKIVARRYSAIFTGRKDSQSEARIKARVEDLQKKFNGSGSEFEKRNLTKRISQLTVGFGIVKIGALSEVDRGYKKDKADDAVNATRAAFQEGVVPGAGLAFKTIADSLPDTYILKKPICEIYTQIRSTAPENFEVPEWVKDPVKVLRVALEKACSVAGALATAGGVTATEKDKPRYVQETTAPVNVAE